jgi:hypothetical protein
MPKEERERIWIDGVHFTEEGYDRMGALIGDELHRLMSGKELKNEQRRKPLREDLKRRSTSDDIKEKMPGREGKLLRSGEIDVQNFEA